MIERATDAASLKGRRAIEALRAGVPNRDAVGVLGFDAEDLVSTFDGRLGVLASSLVDGAEVRGLLLAGEFGAGKSHALEFLTHRALSRNVAVSKVVISKETQLFDPAKVYRAAIEGLQVEGRTGDVLAEIALNKLKTQSPRFAALEEWLRGGEVNSRFAATLWLYQHGGASAELMDRLVGFWGGRPLPLGDLKRDLREVGQVGTFALEKVSTRELARQHFRFMARLLHGAGYDGWLILLDELELMGRYSVLQRGRAYAELARLLGIAAGASNPGLMTVAGITPDFSSAVIRLKDDINQIGFRFRGRDDAESLSIVGLAERAMEEIEQQLIRLPEPDAGRLERTLANLRDVYATAYGKFPNENVELTRHPGWQMREYIRGSITSWDLGRLDPTYSSQVEVNRMVIEYTEDEYLSAPSEGDTEAGDIQQAE
jgi:hypothetical protein